jgi:putative membrane protein
MSALVKEISMPLQKPIDVVLAAVLCSLSLAASAQTKPSHSDVAFMKKAAAGGLAEVELGKIADRKAANERVKQFALRMVADHSKANSELGAIASSKGVQLPTEMDKSTRKEADKLQKLVGPDFDRAYMAHMVADHRKDLKEFRKEAKSGKDADVKSFAARTRPTLQEHLDEALATNDIVQAGKRTGDRVTGSTKK